MAQVLCRLKLNENIDCLGVQKRGQAGLQAPWSHVVSHSSLTIEDGKSIGVRTKMHHNE